ncbi:prohibitin family protein [Streptomyces sp. INA 01156]
MLVLSILLAVAAGVMFFAARAKSSLRLRLRLGAGAALLGSVLSGIASTVYVVSAYEVGVPVTFGRVGAPMTSGMHLKSPFTDVTPFSTRPVDLNLSDKDVVEVRSSQGGDVHGGDREVGGHPGQGGGAVPAGRERGGHSAAAGLPGQPGDRPERLRPLHQRAGLCLGPEEINAEIGKLVKERLAPRGIDITAVNLRNVKPSDSLQKQIDRKIQQKEATERAVEATRTAEEEAKRRKIEAEGIARANEILDDSLTDKVLTNQCIDAYREAAKENPVYAVPCGSGNGTPVIVDGSRRN